MPKKKKLIDKQVTKKATGKCYFCPQTDYAVLDVHRIIPGEEGGEYTQHNSIVCCCLCHRKVHAGQIIIDRKYPATNGDYVLHFWKDGEECWE